jgi:hypothetical protein
MRALSRFAAPLLAVIVPLGFLAGFVPTKAAASPLRACRVQSEWLVGSGPEYSWEVKAPFYISMTHTTAVNIARHVGPGEFGGPGTTAKEVPCQVAEIVANTASNAWPEWSEGAGQVRVTWQGYSRGPFIGVFSCTGISRSDGGAVETCTHNADRHSGHVVVRFTIRAFHE